MGNKIIIEISARHIHLSKTDYDFLFAGEEYKKVKELSQRGEFSTDKTVRIVGPTAELEARFLSPFREETQVELSATDCRTIGISAPYESSSLSGCSVIKIVGNSGEISRCAAIIAKRHIHASRAEAKEFNLSEDRLEKVRIKSSRGEVIFADTVVKIDKNFCLRLHLDTDEGNAAGANEGDIGKIIEN